jgi:hypothetical protein
MTMRILTLTLLAATAAGCSRQPAQPANNSAAGPANAAAASNAAAPTAAPAGNQSAAASGPLAAYAGGNANQEVGGVLFANHPLVRSAVEAAIADPAVRRRVLEPGTAGTIAMRDGRLVSNVCEPHNCGPHNWTILIDPAGGQAEICYHDDATGTGSRWYRAGQEPETRPGDCPSGDQARPVQ